MPFLFQQGLFDDQPEAVAGDVEAGKNRGNFGLVGKTEENLDFGLKNGDSQNL